MLAYKYKPALSSLGESLGEEAATARKRKSQPLQNRPGGQVLALHRDEVGLMGRNIRGTSKVSTRMPCRTRQPPPKSELNHAGEARRMSRGIGAAVGGLNNRAKRMVAGRSIFGELAPVRLRSLDPHTQP